MAIKTRKVGSIRPAIPQSNPVVDKLQQIHARYDNMFSEVLGVLDKYECLPIEIWRVANELQTTGFERAMGGVQVYIDKKIAETKQ